MTSATFHSNFADNCETETPKCASLGCNIDDACVSAKTIMAVAFEEEMNALKLVSGPDGKLRLAEEPYLQVSCRVDTCHARAT